MHVFKTKIKRFNTGARRHSPPQQRDRETEIYLRYSSAALFLCLSVLGLFLSACSGVPTAQISATSTPIPTAPAVARPTYVVQRGDVQEIFEFTGRWQPRDQMQLSFEVNGTVRR